MSQKPYNSKELDAIREKIDELDNRIHDTLMERAELVLKIGEEKRKKNIQVSQPSREARMIKRLLERHSGALPEMAVVRIWRELVGAVSLLQTGLKVAVAEAEERPEYWDIAKDYFGSCLPMQKMGSPLSAIAAVREEKATFAVVPWPNDEDEQPWWAFLGSGTSDPMNIIIRLPHGDDPAAPNPDYRALVVAKAGFDSSGEDRSFLLIECNTGISRARLVNVAEKIKLKPLSLSSKRSQITDQPCLHLLEVDGYISPEKMQEFKENLDDPMGRVDCVGGYPVPPTYSKTIVPKDNSGPVSPPSSERKQAAGL